jgi:hypothetical protein
MLLYTPKDGEGILVITGDKVAFGNSFGPDYFTVSMKLEAVV